MCLPSSPVRPPAPCIAVLLCLLPLACASRFSQGQRAYDDGAYGEAITLLMDAQWETPRTSARERTRYALARGLAHLAVGDMESAHRWLAEAKALYDHDRTVLSAQDRGRLLAGWDALGQPGGKWGAVALAERGF